MYTKFQYESLDTIPSTLADFLMDPDPDGFISMTDLHMELVSSSTDRDRLESNNSWPTFTYYKRLLVQIECDVAAGTPQDFNAFWNLWINTVMILPDILQTSRLQGRLRIRPAGFTEDLLLPCVISDAPVMPRSGGLSRGQMQMTFKGFRPYWVGASSNANLWHV